MSDAEKKIAAALARLREAEPSAGLERRILEGLAERERRVTVARWYNWRGTRSWRPAIALSLACALLLAAGVTSFLFESGRIDSHPRTISRQSAGAPQSAHHKIVSQVSPIQPPGVILPVLRKPHHTPQPNTKDAASGPGFPAPPLPLTEQERLLLRLAHRNDPQVRTILNPEQRAAEAARATEQFQQFFAINAAEMRRQLE